MDRSRVGRFIIDQRMLIENPHILTALRYEVNVLCITPSQTFDSTMEYVAQCEQFDSANDVAHPPLYEVSMDGARVVFKKATT